MYAAAGLGWNPCCTACTLTEELSILGLIILCMWVASGWYTSLNDSRSLRSVTPSSGLMGVASLKCMAGIGNILIKERVGY